MSSTVFTPLSKGFSWTDATTNVDGSPIAAGEVTGFEIGVRADGSTPPAAGTDYAQSVAVQGAAVTSESASAFVAALNLAPGNYWAAIRSLGPVDSAYSAEVPFAIPAPLPVPNPPTGFTAA